MPPSDTPLNKAHQHASNAEDYLNQGLLIPAAEEHYKSAEAFLQCVEQSSDEGTKRTLRMLYNEHNKSGKELQRKIAKLKEEGKDPSLPQVTTAPPKNSERSYTFPPTGSPWVSTSRSGPRGPMSDSSHTIDESYMVLGQQSDPADTFHQFWKTLEGMLDNISQPVAFATAPLLRSETKQFTREANLNHYKNIRREGSSSGDEDFRVRSVPTPNDGTLRSGQSGRERNLHMHKVSSKPSGNSYPDAMEATIVLKSKELSDTSDPEEVMADEDSPSAESFFLIPSATSPLTDELQKENASLKHELASVQHQLEVAERMRVEQEQQIRDRISHARREAQRVMNSSYLPQRQPSLDLSALNLNVPPLPAYPGPMAGGRERETQLLRRIKELEEEVHTVRTDNEKQKAMIVKFRERWEKLKESAKRKRSAKTNTGIDSNVREQRIEEEPDAEVEADDGSR